MPNITAGVQQIATWAGGPIILGLGALALVIAGLVVMYSFRAGAMVFGVVVLGLAVASAGQAIAQSIYGYFR